MFTIYKHFGDFVKCIFTILLQIMQGNNFLPTSKHLQVEVRRFLGICLCDCFIYRSTFPPLKNALSSFTTRISLFSCFRKIGLILIISSLNIKKFIPGTHLTGFVLIVSISTIMALLQQPELHNLHKRVNSHKHF